MLSLKSWLRQRKSISLPLIVAIQFPVIHVLSIRHQFFDNISCWVQCYTEQQGWQPLLLFIEYNLAHWSAERSSRASWQILMFHDLRFKRVANWHVSRRPPAANCATMNIYRLWMVNRISYMYLMGATSVCNPLNGRELLKCTSLSTCPHYYSIRVSKLIKWRGILWPLILIYK